MRVVSPLLKRVVYPTLASSGYFRRRACQGELCVVTYHGVLPDEYQSIDPALDGNLVTADSLRKQLRLIKSSYNVVSAEDVCAWLEHSRALPERAVLLTCDDGLQNTLTDMVPVLREEGVSCLFFVTGASTEDRPSTLWYEDLYLLLRAAPQGELTFPDLNIHLQLAPATDWHALWWSLVKDLSGYDLPARICFLQFLRRRNSWPDNWQARDRQRPAQRRFLLLTVGQLRQLALAGMSIGAHTLSHPILALAPAEVAFTEIAESRRALEAALGKPVWALAYPFGDPASVGVREFEMAERAGYHCAFLNCGGGFPSTIPRFAIPRVHVASEMTLGEFEAHISGFHDGLRTLWRRQSNAPNLGQ